MDGMWSDRTKGGVLLVLSIWLVISAFVHMYTVVTGHIDIVHYVDSARAILEANTLGDRIIAMFKWAPIFPLLLALVIHWAGPAEIYFINPPVVILLMFTMSCWAWHAMKDYWVGMLTVLVAATLFLTTFGHASASMLYPYREPLSFLFVWIGMLLALKAGPSTGAKTMWLWFGSGFAYVLAAAVREPSILAMTGAIGYALAQSGRSYGRRWKNLTALLIPFLAGLMVLGFISILTGSIGSGQFAGWKSMTAGLSLEHWRSMLWRYLHWWRLMCGWPGLILAGIGAAYLLCKRNSALWLIALPMVITLLFYAGFVVASRYAIASAMYLVPLAALGVRMTARAASRLWPRRQWLVERALMALFAGFLLWRAASNPVRIDSQDRVSGREMKQFQRNLHAITGPKAPVATEYRARKMIDALTAQLAYPQPDIRRFGSMVLRHGEGYYLKPITSLSLSSANVPFPNISFEEHVKQGMDIEPVVSEDNSVLSVTLGRGIYEVYRVVSWSCHEVDIPIRSSDVVGRLLWLDFRNSDSEAIRTIEWLDPGGGGHQAWRIQHGNGLIPLAIQPRENPDQNHYLKVTSSSPLPRDLLASPVRLAGGGYFPLSVNRRISIMDWIRPPTYRGAPNDKWGAVFGERGAFQIPVPLGWESGSYMVSIVLEPFRPTPQCAVFHYSGPDRILGVFTNSLDSHRLYHDLVLAPPLRTGSVAINVEVESDNLGNNHFRLAYIGARLVRD